MNEQFSSSRLYLVAHFSIRTRTERLGKHGLTSETCKGAPNPERGDGAEVKGLGSLEAVGPTAEGPKQGKKQKKKKDKPTQCAGTGPCREHRRNKSTKSSCQIDAILKSLDETKLITTVSASPLPRSAGRAVASSAETHLTRKMRNGGHGDMNTGCIT